jgi:hypothetical protein
MHVTYDSAGELAQALRRAADAHDRHEARLGHPDPDWPSWYAQYLFGEQGGDLDQATQGERAVPRD